LQVTKYQCSLLSFSAPRTSHSTRWSRFIRVLLKPIQYQAMAFSTMVHALRNGRTGTISLASATSSSSGRNTRVLISINRTARAPFSGAGKKSSIGKSLICQVRESAFEWGRFAAGATRQQGCVRYGGCQPFKLRRGSVTQQGYELLVVELQVVVTDHGANLFYVLFTAFGIAQQALCKLPSRQGFPGFAISEPNVANCLVSGMTVQVLNVGAHRVVRRRELCHFVVG